MTATWRVCNNRENNMNVKPRPGDRIEVVMHFEVPVLHVYDGYVRVDMPFVGRDMPIPNKDILRVVIKREDIE